MEVAAVAPTVTEAGLKLAVAPEGSPVEAVQLVQWLVVKAGLPFPVEGDTTNRLPSAATATEPISLSVE